MNGDQWLIHTANGELHKKLVAIIDKYDDAHITKTDMHLAINLTIQQSTREIYNRGFSEGLSAAELDGDSNDEYEIEFEDEDNEEGDDES